MAEIIMSLPFEEHNNCKYVRGFPPGWLRSIECANCEAFASINGVIVGHCWNCATELNRGTGFGGEEDMENVKTPDEWVAKGGEYLREVAQSLTAIVQDNAREKRLVLARHVLSQGPDFARLPGQHFPIYTGYNDEDEFASEFEAYSLVICQCCGDAIPQSIETRPPLCQCAVPIYPDYCRGGAAQRDYDDDDVSSGPDSIS